jgi:hypothetical protein
MIIGQIEFGIVQCKSGPFLDSDRDFGEFMPQTVQNEAHEKARPVVSPRGNMTMWTIPMEVKHTQNMTF